VVHVGKPRRHSIERLKGADHLTGGEHLDLQPSAGKRSDGLRNPLG
jgi:hypothetical protein